MAADKKATSGSEAVLDFTNVKDSGAGGFNKRRQPAGDYLGKVTKVVDAPAKGDGVMQWLFTIEINGGTYPYYCKHVENQLWKIRGLFVAAGINVPKKRVKVNPSMVVGKTIGVTLEDDEYDNKKQSNIGGIMPPSEITDQGDDPDDEDDEDEEEETPAPAPKAKAKPAPAPVAEDDDDDEEDDEDDEEEAPAPPPVKKKKAAPKVVADDDLEELDIEDL